ncbi:neuronal membrane glycoprotein M6-a-like [Haliotis rubra]|uniref:neuronal membrane glycoprotein M6-a-like n=1 Tax=Haliotis rubra TaxID=36100 RepID=UPI001EE56DFA|nr:neuronal membrane glycoprotein M6-a-like [Haliotis rubra]
MACIDCLGRTPFGSLLAMIIVIVGVCVFCGTSYQALKIFIDDILNDLFNFKVGWLEVIQVVFVVLAVSMGVFAIILLIFGLLATGATRQNVYSGAKCIMGGRISAAFFMAISYILNLAWIIIMSFSVVPMIMYGALAAICNHEVYSRNAQTINYCFNLTQFGIYRNKRMCICLQNELKRMCVKTTEAGPLFCVAYISALLIVLGMIHFMICLASNYTRIRISKELTEYRDAVEMEELEIQSVDRLQKGPPPYLGD